MTLSACKQEISSNCEAVNWEYYGKNGSEHWAELCTDYSPCGGQAQSPIDILNATIDSSLLPLQMNYQNSQTNIYNNGHTLQYNYTVGSFITLDSQVYDLVEFHFHTGSEHSIDGYRYPAELHLVHKNATTGALVEVGVMIKEGDENPLLNQLLEKLPKEKGLYYRSSETFNVMDLMPDTQSYYTYSGSLSTPPCSEIVTWFVMSKPITASYMQINKMTKLLYNTARPVQPLNGRTIKMSI